MSDLHVRPIIDVSYTVPVGKGAIQHPSRHAETPLYNIGADAYPRYASCGRDAGLIIQSVGVSAEVVAPGQEGGTAMHPAEKAEFDAAELIIKEVYVCARPWTQCWRRAEPMISIYTKAQLVDVMADDPDDVVLADIWDRAPAYDYANRPPLTPKQWLEFGKWLSEESAGQSTDLLENLEAFKPTTCGKRDAATTWVITGTGMLKYNPSLVAASVKVLETSAIPDMQVTFAPGSYGLS